MKPLDSYVLYERIGGPEKEPDPDHYELIQTQHYTLVYAKTHRNLHVSEDDQYLYFIHGELFLRNEVMTEAEEAPVNDNHLIPAYFQREGAPFIRHFKGTFNLFIIHKRERRLLAITGPLGLFPVYEMQQDGSRFLSGDFWYLHGISEKPETDFVSILEYAIFNYPHGANTWDRHIKRLGAARIYEFGTDRKHTAYPALRYEGARPENRIGKKPLAFIEKHFRETVVNLNRKAPYALSVTGGFDGRTVLACAGHTELLSTYTFGAESSHDILYARDAAAQLGIKHYSFLLDDSYYRDFQENARQYIRASNGLNTFERTHYLYAFRKLGAHHVYLLSGNGGSEVFRTIKTGGILVSKAFFTVLEEGRVSEKMLFDYAEHYRLNDYLTFDWKKWIPALKARLEDSLQPYLREANSASYAPVFRYLMDHTIPNWFGIEMSVASKYIMNRSPYLDIDFLNAVIRTEFCAHNQNKAAHNPVKRRRGQMPYAFIIRKNHALLSKIQTNKGYAPSDVVHPAGIFRLVAAQVKKKFRSDQANSDRDFNSRLSFDEFLDSLNGENVKNSSFINLRKLRSDVGAGNFDKRTASKLMSIHYWGENLLN